MKIIELDQDSKEWHEWRSNGIGASDVSVIMGNNPYKTPLMLWEQINGFRESEPINIFMKKGKNHEPIIRDRISHYKKLNYIPLCVEHDDYECLRASLDGYNPEKHEIIEIKKPSSQKIISQLREKNVPQYWLDQMQWQMFIVNCDVNTLIWTDDNDILYEIRVERDEKYIKKMFSKVSNFWSLVKMGVPPTPESKDYIESTDQNLKCLLIEYERLSKKEKEIKQEKEDIKAQIEMGVSHNTVVDNYKIAKMNAPSRYDYEKMKKDGIDLDKYKKVSNKSFWRIILPSSKSS